MSQISLPLPPNVLHNKKQTLDFDKIATFIGGNGSGKSTILKSIFDEKLNGSNYEDHIIVCFSSGQNESYSDNFSQYLSRERSKKNALNLDCFYYDKSWSKLLIFLATTGKHGGLVRSFLRDNKYVEEDELDVDVSTQISFDVKVGTPYIDIVKSARKDEAESGAYEITQKAYHNNLESFINSIFDKEYDFEQPIELKTVDLNQNNLSEVSFESDEGAPFDSKATFFTQAADNDYFIIKNSFSLTFNKDKVTLRLEDLSDGEYQLLFLYALIDLFDTEHTLFLFDEADSHLHYKNIDRLWNVFNGIQGKVITTTHLIDSITKSGTERLAVIENGQVKPGRNLEHLTARLQDLSAINNIKFQALSLFQNVVLIDDENDWELFKLLAIKKLAKNEDDINSIQTKLDNFIAVKCTSGYDGREGQIFAKSKICYANSLTTFLEDNNINTKNIFMICDRDEYHLINVGDDTNMEGCRLLISHEVLSNKTNNFTKHLLCWRRREIKHYLLSNTALSSDDTVYINEFLADMFQIYKDFNGDKAVRKKIEKDAAGNEIEVLYEHDEFNNQLASIDSEEVKELLKKYIENGENGLCLDKTQKYVESIPANEISEDIEHMYNYLVGDNA